MGLVQAGNFTQGSFVLLEIVADRVAAGKLNGHVHLLPRVSTYFGLKNRIKPVVIFNTIFI